MSKYSEFVPSLEEIKNYVDILDDERIILHLMTKIQDAVAQGRKGIQFSIFKDALPSDINAFKLELKSKGFEVRAVANEKFRITWK